MTLPDRLRPALHTDKPILIYSTHKLYVAPCSSSIFQHCMHTCTHSQCCYVHTPLPKHRTLVGLAKTGDNMQPPSPRSPRLHGPESKLCAGPLQSFGVRLCVCDHMRLIHTECQLCMSGCSFWIKNGKTAALVFVIAIWFWWNVSGERPLRFCYRGYCSSWITFIWSRAWR